MTRNSPRTIRAKFAGTCHCCGASIAAGEMVDYYPAMRKIAHVGGLDGNSARCTVEIRKRPFGGRETRGTLGYADVDRMYEDQCADICGR